MRILTGVAAVIAMLCLAAPARAQMVDVWELSTRGATCEVTFSGKPKKGGYFLLKRRAPCDNLFTSLSRYKMSQDGHQITFAEKKHLTPIASASRQGQDFVGTYGDGVPFRVVYLGKMHPNGAGAGQTGAVSSETAQCLRYHGTRRCAQSDDVGAPDVARGVTSLETVATMNVRFLGNRNSSQIGTLQKRTCTQVHRCSTSLLDKDVWCEIQLDDIKTGWILKQDAEFVYARNGCG